MKSVFMVLWCCCFVLIVVAGCDQGMNMMKPATQGIMEEIDDPYTPLEGFTVSPNRVGFVAGGFRLEAGVTSCRNLDGANFSGVIYNTHTFKWQHREDPTSPWTDIPETKNDFGICGYVADIPGQYRAVWEGSIDDVSGKYASENILTVE